jgi:hypothetical protein
MVTVPAGMANERGPFLDQPVYVSDRCLKSLWQEYRIWPDRLELACWILLRTLVIPFQDIRSVHVRRPRLSGGLLVLKPDLSDLFTHVALTRRSGLFKSIRFTPDDPEAFVRNCRSVAESSGLAGWA